MLDNNQISRSNPTINEFSQKSVLTISSFLPDRELWRKIYTIVLPISLQSMLMVADSTIDSLMLGKIGQDALASVSLAGNVRFIYGILLSTCSSAFSIFASQYWGKRDIRTSEKLLGMAIQVSVSISFVFWFVTFFFPRQVMTIFTSEELFLSQGADYLRYLSVSYFFLAISQSMAVICRCSGHARQILAISCATVPLDIIFNYVFIFGINGFLKMGVVGAAIASVIVRFIGLLLTFWEFKRERIFRIHMFYITHAAVSLYRHVVRYTFPILGNYVCYGAGVVTASIIMGHQTKDAVAANALARVVINASGIFFSGLGGGVVVILGNTLGEGNMEKAKDTGRRLFTFAFLAGIASSILMLGSIPFVHCFAELTDCAVDLTRWMLLLSVPSMIGKACNGFSFSAFNTGGDSKFSCKLDFCVVLCFMIPLGFIAYFLNAPVLVLFFIVYMDEFVKAPFAYIHYRKNTWLKNLTSCSK